MAGLLYLPRLFVYHAGGPAGSDRAATFKVMERRLLRGIMLPAAIMTYGFGLLLAATPGIVDWRQGWIWAKLALVVRAHRVPPAAGALARGTSPPDSNRASARFYPHGQRAADAWR